MDMMMDMMSGDILLVSAIMMPFIGVLLGFVLGGRWITWVAAAVIATGVANAAAVAQLWQATGGTLSYVLGGWAPPLGIELRADGLAVAMMLAVAVVIVGIGIYARGSFPATADPARERSTLVFWMLLMAIWGSLNLVFLSGDLFTLYVGLELLTFAAVPLVSLDGRGDTLRSALRYLLYALLGSVFYLLGAVLLYGAYGTLDIQLLASALRPDLPTVAAAALMTTGLMAKTALFPLHLWLPPAHAGAPAAASAILSGLVIKGSWFLAVRLWFDVFPDVITFSSAQLLAACGAGAILVGNVVALRQQRLKLLVAYSTVAQIGYLFLMFPLSFSDVSSALARGVIVDAGLMQAISHAFAKAAMFMAAGSVYYAVGHDRINGIQGVGRALPLTVLAFALAGFALMGLPPSGAWVAKKAFLDAAASSGQWWWAWVLQAGGMLTASYVVLVLGFALRRADGPAPTRGKVSRISEVGALALAVIAVVLGVVAAASTMPNALSGAFSTKELGTALVTLTAGALLATALALHSPMSLGPLSLGPLNGLLRGIGGAVSALAVRFDTFLRQWAIAGLALLAVSLAFGWTLRGGI